MWCYLEFYEVLHEHWSLWLNVPFERRPCKSCFLFFKNDIFLSIYLLLATHTNLPTNTLLNHKLLLRGNIPFRLVFYFLDELLLLSATLLVEGYQHLSVNDYNIINQATSLLLMIKDYEGTDGTNVNFFCSDVALKYLANLFPSKLFSIVSVPILMLHLFKSELQLISLTIVNLRLTQSKTL